MTRGLHIAPGCVLPLDAVTETFGILAKKGAGKSNAAVVMAEEMYAAGVPWVAVDPKGDWWGLRASGDGKGAGLPAALNKDVLTQVDTLIVLRTTSPQDRAAVKAWVDVHADAGDMLATLPSLESGEAWLWSPEFLGELKRIRFRRRNTFDSGATPKVGQTRRTPATLADVDLAAIKEQMAETIEKAKADDPRELKKRIRDLEQQAVSGPKEVTVTVEVPILDDDTVIRLERLYDQLSLAFTEWAEELRSANELADQVIEQTNSIRAVIRQGDRDARPPTPQTPLPGRRQPTGARPTRAASPSAPAASPRGSSPMTAGELQDHYRSILRSGAVKMLDALIEVFPRGLTREELGAAAEIATSGGTFSTYLSDLVRNGLAERHAGELVATAVLMYGADQ